MRVNHTSAFRRARRQMARALACVLLAGIVYSVSLGTVHSHGNTLQGFEPNASTNLSEQVGTSFTLPVRGRSQTDECLICVLHRQLFSSTVDAPHFIVTPVTPIASVAAAPVFYHSTPIVSSPIAHLSGRAPPRHLG